MAALAAGAYVVAGTLLGTANGTAWAAEHSTQSGGSAAVLPTGPEPYVAADPQDTPMASEPLLAKPAVMPTPSLTDR